MNPVAPGKIGKAPEILGFGKRGRKGFAPLKGKTDKDHGGKTPEVRPEKVIPLGEEDFKEF